LSERDGLTGLYNRCTFMDKLAERLGEEGDEPSAILYIDLDNFKAVNDTHGHQAGDKVLITLSKMLHQLAQRGDLPARLGGDEFLIWISDADQARAETAAQDLIDDGRRTMARMSASDEKPLGMSIGVALHLPGVAETAAELVAKADHVMYTAKQSGKNRFATISHLPEPR
jgi:diguanylate cyclase (GGDEF)-like protein